MVFRHIVITIIFFLTISAKVTALPVNDYLPENHQYNPQIPTPQSVLGFTIGERHARHDQLLSYIDQLDQNSDRVMVTTMGLTHQLRKQQLITFSSPKNLANLEAILDQRQDPKNDKNPLVIWLGYSVHGDEISGTNAAMVIAYYLAASQNAEVEALLTDTIIVMEPSINPDGMDRFVSWVNNYRGSTANDDPNHIEHHQPWFTGRTNHFGFDLNRDWLLLSQQESQNRLKYYHRYQPNVLGDFHEMGASGSYFFQPGIPSRTNPLTPPGNIELTNELAHYHAQSLDKEKHLYFTQESFDDFYYGKGSTYPDINGAVGILFEQASSRGYQQQTVNGLLTFDFGIKNHVLTSLSTIKGAWENREKLKHYRKTFYQQSDVLAKKEKFSGYLLHEADDSYRLTAMLNKLTQHQIAVYPLAGDFRHDGKLFSSKNSYFVPLVQPQYRVIKALFEQNTHFADNTFYDVSGWTLPLAMNIEFYPVERTWGLKLAEQQWQPASQSWIEPDRNAYAYIFEWQHFLAPKLLNQLLTQKLKARVATQAFTSVINGVSREFKAGSIVIPAGIQHATQWQQRLSQASKMANIELIGISSGLTVDGIDLGSDSFANLPPVSVLLVGGDGISQYEAGELLFYLDDTLGIPVTVVEHQRLAQVTLQHYTHILLVNGDYKSVSPKFANQLENWTKQGGVVFAQKNAAKWLAEQSMLKASFVSDKRLDQLFTTTNLTYQDKESLAARKRIAGAIFESTLDTSHPLAYGYAHANLPLFRNSTLMMETIEQPFVTVAKYTEAPLLSGYSDENLTSTLATSPAIVAHNLGDGRLIATTDVLSFRGYWYGSAKIIANSLFFGKIFNTPIKN